jgi:hypothetical protein
VKRETRARAADSHLVVMARIVCSHDLLRDGGRRERGGEAKRVVREVEAHVARHVVGADWPGHLAEQRIQPHFSTVLEAVRLQRRCGQLLGATVRTHELGFCHGRAGCRVRARLAQHDHRPYVLVAGTEESDVELVLLQTVDVAALRAVVQRRIMLARPLVARRSLDRRWRGAGSRQCVDAGFQRNQHADSDRSGGTSDRRDPVALRRR